MNINILKKLSREDAMAALDELNLEQLATLSNLVNLSYRVADPSSLETQLEEHIFAVNQTIVGNKEPVVEQDALLETLSMVEIRGSKNVRSIFHPASAIIGEIGEKGVLEFGGKRISQIYVPRMYGGKFTRNMTNKISVLGEEGALGWVQHSKLLMGARPIRGVSDIVIFQIEVEGQKISIIWNSYEIKILKGNGLEALSNDMFGWFRDSHDIIYDYTHYKDNMFLNQKPVVKVPFEYLTRDLLRETVSGLQVMVDGKLFMLLQEKTFILQHIGGKYYDKNFFEYKVNGVPPYSGMCEIVSNGVEHKFRVVRYDRYVPDSTQDITILLTSGIVVDDLDRCFYLSRKPREIVEKVKLGAASEDKRAEEYNKGDLDFVYNIIEMQDMITQNPELDSNVGKGYEIMKFIQKSKKMYVHGRECESYMVDYDCRGVFKGIIVDKQWYSRGLRVAGLQGNLYMSGLTNKHVLVTFSIKIDSKIKVPTDSYSMLNGDKMYYVASVLKSDWKIFFEEYKDKLLDIGCF